jgi:hypothetical protein
MSDIPKSANSHALTQLIDSRMERLVNAALVQGESKEAQVEKAISKTVAAAVSLASADMLGDDYGDVGWIAAVGLQFFGSKRLASLSIAQIESLLMEMLGSIDPDQLFSDLLAGPAGGLATSSMINRKSIGVARAVGRLSGQALGKMAAVGINVASSGFSVAYSLSSSMVGAYRLNHRPVSGKLNKSYQTINYRDIPLKTRVGLARLIRSFMSVEDIPSKWKNVHSELKAPGVRYDKHLINEMPEFTSFREISKL